MAGKYTAMRLVLKEAASSARCCVAMVVIGVESPNHRSMKLMKRFELICHRESSRKGMKAQIPLTTALSSPSLLPLPPPPQGPRGVHGLRQGGPGGGGAGGEGGGHAMECSAGARPPLPQRPKADGGHDTGVGGGVAWGV